MNPESERQDQILNDDEVGPGNYDSRTYLNAEKPLAPVSRHSIKHVAVLHRLILLISIALPIEG